MKRIEVEYTVIRGYDMLGNPSQFTKKDVFEIEKTPFFLEGIVKELCCKLYPAAHTIKVNKITHL